MICKELKNFACFVDQEAKYDEVEPLRRNNTRRSNKMKFCMYVVGCRCGTVVTRIVKAIVVVYQKILMLSCCHVPRWCVYVVAVPMMRT